LVVDDEPEICRLLSDGLGAKGYDVITCTEGDEAVAIAKEIAKQEGPCVVLLDIKMPVMNGVQTLGALKNVLPRASYVMITGHSSSDLVEESFSNGATLCLAKPLGIAKILDVVESLRQDLEEAQAESARGGCADASCGVHRQSPQ